MSGHIFVPFLGDFFSITTALIELVAAVVFVPFLGDFLSIKQI